jgi:hypothetical protein
VRHAIILQPSVVKVEVVVGVLEPAAQTAANAMSNTNATHTGFVSSAYHLAAADFFGIASSGGCSPTSPS